jgi:hypothetical protein
MKILLVRTIQVDRLEGVIEQIKSQYEDALIDILDNGKHKSTFEIEGINSIKEMKKVGDFSLYNIGLSKLREIRRQKYDILFIPHKQYGLSGFDNVLFLALGMRIKKWFGYQFGGKIYKINKYTLVNVSLKILFSICVFIPVLLVSSLLISVLFIKIGLVNKKCSTSSAIDKWYAGYGDI